MALAGVVLLSQSTRQCDYTVMRERVQKDSRCGMSGVAFRTAPLIGGSSCSGYLSDVQNCERLIWTEYRILKLLERS